jgi:peptidoglycan/xylan/chitin deacetylase (PgdA/CDA1 family)
MNKLTIVMYHYVRPIIGSKFPGIKGLELDGFKRQLDYLTENFNIINTKQLINGVRKGAKLPNNACWLTFDDGYKDHYDFVLPELLTRNLHGAFFPPRTAIEDDVVLDVNSIHHILSCCNDINELVSKLNAHCLSAGISERKISLFYEELAVANRFDNANTIYVKRMLQHSLPEELRSSITKNLFQEFVGLCVEDFSKELYMNIEEVQNLVKNGMYVGSHGSRHYWFDKILPDEQEKEIQESLMFIEEIGSATKDWVMCYPYGAYNNSTLTLLKKYKASAAITTEARIANLTNDNPFKLPRLDTNDFPQ